VGQAGQVGQAAQAREAGQAGELAVSVIMPARNAARHIAAAIESALAQSIEDSEIIVIDDGSTDDTAAIAGRFAAARGERVRVIRQAQAGVSAARNRGIDTARGRYIAFLDADDWFLSPTKLADQAAILDARPEVGIVHSGWRRVGADGEPLTESRPWMRAPVLDLEGWLLWQAALPSAMMMRRDALTAVGGFDVTLAHLEDIDLALRITLEGYATAWLEQVTTAYRQHGANSTRRLDESAAATRIVLDRFFARRDLPSGVQALAGAARAGAFRWLAVQYCRAGAWADAIRMLQAALPFVPGSSSGVALLALLDGVESTLREQFDAPLDAYALMSQPGWQALVRTHILGRSIHEATRPITPFPYGPGRREAQKSRPSTPALRDPADATIRPLAIDTSAVEPRLDLSAALAGDYGRHRSGWAYALRSLKPLHRDGGVFVDAFTEHTFGNHEQPPPHQHPWIGFLHNPPNMPKWFVYNQSPQQLLANEAFQASLPHCLGMFCLSEYTARWWRERIDRPVDVVHLPTDRSSAEFSMEGFAANVEKRVVQVGSWLRRLHSIHYLPVTRLKRAIVHQHKPYIDNLMRTERQQYRLEADGRVERLPFLEDEQYDELFARNIMYLDLYDSSANNVVVECLERTTPLLVNPLPAVVEYLGPDYPFYFTRRVQAARKAENLSLIEATHRYLVARSLQVPLSGEAFAQAVARSSVYQRLAETVT
jgi:glycosyltransferase involved in cell wall biosynthesis